MYYVVTGAAGFIGSNIVKALNARGVTDIIAVDNLTRADKFRNLVDCELADYIDKTDFLQLMHKNALDGAIAAIFHHGACTDAQADDGRYVMENNYRYSMDMLDFCQENQAAFLYASSAEVYGAGNDFTELRQNESPLNINAYSKFLFDQAVRRIWDDRTAQIVGLRYFDVYGQGEQHKADAASFVYQYFYQFMTTGKVTLFKGAASTANGEQCRDFVAVDDVVQANMWFLDHPAVSGIFNIGTGRALSANDVAVAVINQCRQLDGKTALELAWLQAQGMIEYVDFPARRQSFTRADISALRQAGFDAPMIEAEQGMASYVDALYKQYKA
jgi:ADP-L-glycero-D-manno-heptose 6-epimerase